MARGGKLNVLGSYDHGIRCWRTLRLVHNDLDTFQRCHGLLDTWVYLRPGQPPTPAAQRWNGNRSDAQALNVRFQRFQPCLNVLQVGFATPVAFGWEVDDVVRRQDTAGLGDQHAPRLHLAGFTGADVLGVIIRVRLLELQRNAFAHDTHAVNCVDQGLGFGFQDVACGIGDHGWSFLSSTTDAGCAPAVRCCGWTGSCSLALQLDYRSPQCRAWPTN